MLNLSVLPRMRAYCIPLYKASPACVQGALCDNIRLLSPYTTIVRELLIFYWRERT
ncbi:hypothetical protein HMPREF1992_01802 [Selenomonas sp. oral taxon 892 str. F0426]|nr:hypothetical protein HMPREF1992_01802 [Selenomonas sp. oral taxon 892 str. F0426]